MPRLFTHTYATKRRNERGKKKKITHYTGTLEDEPTRHTGLTQVVVDVVRKRALVQAVGHSSFAQQGNPTYQRPLPSAKLRSW